MVKHLDIRSNHHYNSYLYSNDLVYGKVEIGIFASCLSGHYICLNFEYCLFFSLKVGKATTTLNRVRRRVTRR